MNRVIRALFWTMVVVLVLSGVTWAGLAIRQNVVYGEVLTEQRLSATVEVGDRFSVSVPDMWFTGNNWSAEVVPSAGVAFIDQRVGRSGIGRLFDLTSDDTIGGSRGALNFIYEATQTGTVTVTLSRCSKNCMPGAADTELERLAWTITVT